MTDAMSRATRLEFLNVELNAMKKMMLCVLAGAIFSLTSGLTQAEDCCCQKKCWSLPKLKMPHLKLRCCKPKCDPCCAAAPSCAAPAAMPAADAAPAPAPDAPPKPSELTPSAAEPKK